MPASSISDRANKQRLFAFVAYDTIEVIIERIETMVRTGRRMTIVRRWLGSDNTEVYAGLHLDEDSRDGGFHIWRQQNPEGVSLGVYTNRMRGFGISAYVHEGDEETVARRFRSDRPVDATLIEIEGNGEGTEDKIEITSYNQYGVGEQVIVAFDRVSDTALSRQHADLLDTLRAQVENGDTLDADRLRNLAAQVRYYREPLADYLAYEASDPRVRAEVRS